MKLPVVICSHNRAKLLRQTIESLKANSDFELQIIVVDDSEDKETVDYLEGLTDITYYHFRTTGPIYGPRIGQAKMKGADLAKPSKYIYFSDDDVYFMPHWDTYLIKALEENKDLVIVGGRGVHGHREPRPLLDRLVGLTNLQTGYSMMFRRKDWNKHGYFPNYDEDTWLCREIQSRSGKQLGVIEPSVIIHCGYTRVSRQSDGGGGKTFDYSSIEEDMKIYPEVYFE